MRAEETTDPISRGRSRRGDAAVAGGDRTEEKVDPREFIASNDLLEDSAAGERAPSVVGEGEQPLINIILLPR